MQINRIGRALALGSLVSFLALPGLSLAASDGTVKQLGRTVMRYKDDTIQIVIGYRYSSNNLKEPWLMLDTRIHGWAGKTVSINREDVSLALPDGREIPLPTQKTFGERFTDIERFLMAAQPSREPLNGYFVGPRYEEKMRFFTVPGRDVVRDEIYASHTYLLVGDLFFPSSEGEWKPGLYALIIKNRDINVKLPFQLPGQDLGKKKADTAVPW